MTVTTELTPLLKRLKLGAMLNTLPERIALARREQLDSRVLPPGHPRRRGQPKRPPAAGAPLPAGPASSSSAAWKTSTGPHPSPSTDGSSTPPFSLQFLARKEHVLLVGPVGVGKSFIAQALGYAAIRAGHSVRFLRADDFLRAMAQARVDHSTDKTFRSFLSPDLLILDDLGLHKLTQQQSIDLYELVIARHRTASFVITSNRAVDEWLGLFDDSHPRQQRARPACQRQLPDRHRR